MTLALGSTGGISDSRHKPDCSFDDDQKFGLLNACKRRCPDDHIRNLRVGGEERERRDGKELR